VRIPHLPRLVTQLRQIVAKPVPGGGTVITSPRRRGGGGHGDLVSALVNALWATKDEELPLWATPAFRQGAEQVFFGEAGPAVRANRGSGLRPRATAYGYPPLFNSSMTCSWSDDPEEPIRFLPTASPEFKAAAEACRVAYYREYSIPVHTPRKIQHSDNPQEAK
jgi:hypothetical protein